MPPTIQASSPRVVAAGAVLALLCATAALLLFPLQTEAELTAGLIAHYTFDGPDVTDKVYDRSGQGNNAYVYDGGATSSMKTAGKLGQALRFSGVNDSETVISSATVAFGTALSFAFWMKDEGSINGDIVVSWSNWRVCGRSGGGGSFKIGCTGDVGVSEVLSTTDVFGDGQWHHIVYTLTAGSQVLYVDGVQEGAGTPSIDTATGAFQVAARTFNSARYKGLVDDVRFYNRVLSAAEAKQLYQLGKALQKPPNNLGLVGYWSFNEGTGTVATDFSGNGNTGTLTAGPTWTDGKRGKALNFDGSGARVAVTQSSGLPLYSTNTAYSVSAWVRGPAQIGGGIFHESNSGGNAEFVIVTDSASATGKLEIIIVNDAGSVVLDSKPDVIVLDNTWHHVVFADNNGTGKLYLDGVPFDVNYTRSGAYTLNRTTIGATDGGGFAFTGTIDEVRIYSRALAASEVAKLYQSGAVKINASSADLDNGSSLESGLVGHWTFDGQDTNWTSANTGVTYDRSGNNNAGTLTSMNRKTFGRRRQTRPGTLLRRHRRPRGDAWNQWRCRQSHQHVAYCMVQNYSN